MSTAQSYAQSLYQLVEKHPERGALYLKNLRSSLAARGHDKLLPRIWSEYQKLAVHTKRMSTYAQVTPQMKRTRVLLELYHKLIATK